MSKPQSRPGSRSAKSGQFVTKGFAKSHPSTTVNERIPLPKKAK